MFLTDLFKNLFLNRSSYNNLPEYYKSFDFNSLENILGYKIVNPELYVKAFSHKSFAEFFSDHLKSNERLEFLGDSVLNLVVSKILFNKLINEEEGILTKIRSNLVKKESLTEVAEKLNLLRFMYYDKKLINESDEGKKTIISDAVEAFIGAIFLDKGLDAAHKFINTWIVEPNFENNVSFIDTNFKGQLLEFVHSKKLPIPAYKVIKEEGPEHDKRFTIEVFLKDTSLGLGFGKTKKSAEQIAAKSALETLQHDESLMLIENN
ncbi:MAG: ribonuclease III [bacterium]